MLQFTVENQVYTHYGNEARTALPEWNKFLIKCKRGWIGDFVMVDYSRMVENILVKWMKRWQNIKIY